MLDLGIGRPRAKIAYKADVQNRHPSIAPKAKPGTIVADKRAIANSKQPVNFRVDVSEFNKAVNSRTPNPVNAPNVSTNYAGQSPSNPKLIDMRPIDFKVNPAKPVSPRMPTPFWKPKSRAEFNKRRLTPLQRIKARISPGGAPPPSPKERTVHRTIPQWTAWLNSIPAAQRSVSGRDVAMTPRIDESSPTNVASAVVPINYDVVEGVSSGQQEDNSPPMSKVTDMAFLIAIAFFGYFFVVKGR